MEQEKILKFLKESNLKNLIKTNLNRNQVINELDPEKKLKLNYYYLEKYIKEHYKKVWDKKTKRWVDLVIDVITNNVQTDSDCVDSENQDASTVPPGQTSFLAEIDAGAKKVDAASPTETLDKSNTNNSEDIRPTKKGNGNSQDPSNKKTSINNASYEEILSLLKTFDARIAVLDGFYNEAKNHIKSADKKSKMNNNDTSLIDIDEVIKLYTSSKNKKSVNINKELKDKVIEYIYKEYKFNGNESLAINIALLLALYKK